MKHLIISSIIFVLVLVISFLGSFTILHQTKSLSDKINTITNLVTNDDFDTAKQELENLSSIWKKTQNMFIPFINMTRIDEISEKLYAIEPFCNKEQKPHMLSELSSLNFLIKDLRQAEELSVFSLT